MVIPPGKKLLAAVGRFIQNRSKELLFPSRLAAKAYGAESHVKDGILRISRYVGARVARVE